MPVENRLPLPTLLSEVLVAFTIELDNEFERQIVVAGTRLRFLVSLVMWSNFMRFVDDDGLTVGELSSRAGVAKGATHPSLAGMRRWGYVAVDGDEDEGAVGRRTRPPRSDWIVRPTGKGRAARQVWRPLAATIEERWRARFGDEAIGQLRMSLCALVDQTDIELPAYLPVLGHGMVPARFDATASRRPRRGRPSELELPALLSHVLLTFALEYERESKLSIAIGANLLRIVDPDGVRVRDLPRRAGVSKEAIAMMVGYLERRGDVVVGADAAQGRSKLVRFTPQGRNAQDTYRRLLGAVEARWGARFGEDHVGDLRDALQRLVGDPDAGPSPLFSGLEPYPQGWRASVPRPDVLAHYPTVLHRGGWPDGS